MRSHFSELYVYISRLQPTPRLNKVKSHLFRCHQEHCTITNTNIVYTNLCHAAYVLGSSPNSAILVSFTVCKESTADLLSVRWGCLCIYVAAKRRNPPAPPQKRLQEQSNKLSITRREVLRQRARESCRKYLRVVNSQRQSAYIELSSTKGRQIGTEQDRRLEVLTGWHRQPNGT